MFSQEVQSVMNNNVQVVTNLKKSAKALEQHNLQIVSVGWDDVSRAFNSSIGSNISDWTFKLKDGTILPFIRSPNFTDKTLTISAKDISLIVGNERPNGNLKAITFQKIHKGIVKGKGKNTPDFSFSNFNDLRLFIKNLKKNESK